MCEPADKTEELEKTCAPLECSFLKHIFRWERMERLSNTTLIVCLKTNCIILNHLVLQRTIDRMHFRVSTEQSQPAQEEKEIHFKFWKFKYHFKF